MEAIRDLDFQCDRAIKWPLNVNADTLPYVLEAQYRHLDGEEERIFHNEKNASLDFLDFGESSKDYWDYRIHNLRELRDRLGVSKVEKRRDPWCRFLFIHARDSRDKLCTTREMLMLAFTYFRVMPEFVDFLFPFGRRRRAQDFHFSGFRQRTRLCKGRRGPRIDQLGWSGCDIQMCYNLKSVESSSSQPSWPWSTRQCAVNHSFDIVSIRATWIVIKGDPLIQQRIQSATSERGPPGFRNLRSLDRAFAASLEVHSLLAHWAAENWRWYINFLEDTFHEISRRTISNEVDLPLMSPVTDASTFPGPRRVATDLTVRSAKSIFSKISRRRTDTLPSIQEKRDRPPLEIFTNPVTQLSQPLAPGYTRGNTEKATRSLPKYDEFGQQEFSFSDLQDIHHIDKMTNEAALVIKHNLSILTQLTEYYQGTVKLPDFPPEIRNSCSEDLREFEMNIAGIQADLRVQVARIETLLRLVANLKTLKLHGILEFRNTQSNKSLAQESRASTFNMEIMTNDMNEIAGKTKTETVSMKIITLVTLFFLPGTFISVCDIFIWTLMSTDIFQSNNTRHLGPDRYASLSPLQVYLAASLPLTFVTLMIWAGFHWVERNKEKMRKLISQAKRAQSFQFTSPV